MTQARAFFLALILACAGTQAHAGSTGSFAVLGQGNKECPQVLDDYNAGDIAHLANMVWLTGYLTAMNRTAKAADITGGMSPEILGARVIAYCSQHPEAGLADAAQALVHSLKQGR